MSDHAESVFEQYWNHARHQETQRLTFTSFYGAIVAAAFAFLGSQFIDVQSRVFLSFAMIVLSFLGFFLMHAWRIPFLIYSRLAEAIMIKELKLEKYRRFGEYDKLARASPIFHFFYVLMASLFVSFFLEFFSQAYPDIHISGFTMPILYVRLIGFVVIFLFLSIVYAAVFRRAEKNVELKIKKKIKIEC